MFPKIDMKALANPKEWFRLHAQTLRKDLARQRPDASVHAAAHFMRALAPPAETMVAVYYPSGSELDTWPLVEALFEARCQVCLPVVITRKAPLVFRAYTRDTELAAGAYKIMAPADGAATVIPDIVVCPLLAFRPDGTRLGMGGGYYDRTLAQLRRERHVTVVGYAFAGQEAKQLPAEKHDERLDWIVTERAAMRTA